MKDIDCHVKNVGAYLVGNESPSVLRGITIVTRWLDRRWRKNESRQFQ